MLKCPFRLWYTRRILNASRMVLFCVADANCTGAKSHVVSPLPLFDGLRSLLCWSMAPHNGLLVWFSWHFLLHILLLQTEALLSFSPFSEERFFFFFSFHLTLQSILFCADVGGRMLESSLAKGQVCLSNKNKQTAKCEGEAGLETT